MKKTILILESNLSGYGYSAIQFLKSSGYHTLFMCREPKEYGTSVTNPLEVADEVALVDTYDIGKILDFISNFDGEIIHCLAFDDFRVLQSAIVNQHLAVGCNPSLDALLACRFKSVLRKRLAGSEYAIEHNIFSAADTALAYAEPVFGFPCVVKPVDENGSLAVRICDDKEDLKEAIDFIRALPASNSRGYSSSRKFIIEEYIGGHEYSGEMVWDAGTDEWVLLGVTKKYVTAPPYCVELGHIFPYHLDPPLHEKVLSGLRGIMRIIGLKNTFAHVEFKIFNGEFYVIEINPRPGGDMIAELMQLAKGFNPIEMMVLSNLDQPLKRHHFIGKNDTAGIAFLAEGSACDIENITIDDDEYVRAKVFSLPRRVAGVRNSDDRLGYAVYTNASFSYVEKKLDGFISGDLFTVHAVPSPARS